MRKAAVAVVFFLTVAGPVLAGTLYDAARNGDLEALRDLLGAGAFVDEPGRNAETPLMAAAVNRQTDAANLLIAEGANVMARNRGGFTPLHAAAYGGELEIVQLMMSHGAELEDNENVSGHTPLFLAAEENHSEVAGYLLDLGANPSAVDREGFSVLTQTWAKQRIEIVRLLKDHGAICQSAAVMGSESFHRRCVAAGE